jgi:hypothetical protein
MLHGKIRTEKITTDLSRVDPKAQQAYFRSQVAEENFIQPEHKEQS